MLSYIMYVYTETARTTFVSSCVTVHDINPIILPLHIMRIDSSKTDVPLTRRFHVDLNQSTSEKLHMFQILYLRHQACRADQTDIVLHLKKKAKLVLILKLSKPLIKLHV